MTSGVVEIERALLVRVGRALRDGLTKRGHLAQRVPHEHLGYCSWRSESKLCVAFRALLDDIDALLGDT